MNRLFVWLTALSLALFPALSSAQMPPLPGFPAGVLILAGAGSAPIVNHIAIDGTSARSDATSTSATLTLTTANAGDFIVIADTSNSALISSISDTAGLTWARRKTYTGPPGNSETWWAVAPGVLSSDVITVTYAASTFHTTIAFGLSGVVPSSQFDSNGSLPSTSVTATTTFSTSNAADFLLDVCQLSAGTGTVQSGWTSITNTNFMLVQYQNVTVTQSGATVGPVNFKSQIADAIVSQ